MKKTIDFIGNLIIFMLILNIILLPLVLFAVHLSNQYQSPDWIYVTEIAIFPIAWFIASDFVFNKN